MSKMGKGNSKVGKQNDKNIIQKYAGQCKGKQKGAEFVSRVLKGKEVTVFEFKYLDDFDNTVDFILNHKLIDGKSWSVTKTINKIGSGWKFPKQLTAYFKKGDFELWFDYA